MSASWSLAAVRVLPAIALLVLGLLTPTSELYPHQGDVGLYLQKAEELAAGRVPYRDVPLEYPPLALVPLLAPYLAWPFGTIGLDQYKWLFLAWQCLLLVGLGYVLRRLADAGARGGDRSRARLWVAAGLVALTLASPFALAWRLDLFPALLTAVALWAALERRSAAAGVALGLAVLAKAYPVVLVPALAAPWLFPLRARGVSRFAVGLAATLALGMLPFVVVAGNAAWRFLSYQADRGLQIESIGGSLVLLAGLVRGETVPLDFGFSAVQVTGPLADAWLSLLPPLTLAGFGALAVVGWRRARAEMAVHGEIRPATIGRLATASILVLLVTNKVFSVQYVVWLLPFAALLPRGQLALAAVVGLLSTLVHPMTYLDLVAEEPYAVLLLVIRNALAIALAAWVVADIGRRAAVSGR